MSFPNVLYTPTETASNDAYTFNQAHQTFNCNTFVSIKITNKYTKLQRRKIASRLALELNQTKDLISRIEFSQIGNVGQPISTHVPKRKMEKFKLPEGWQVLTTSDRKSGKTIMTYRDPEEKYPIFCSLVEVQAYIEDGILPVRFKSEVEIPTASDGTAGKKRNAPDVAVKNKKVICLAATTAT